MNSRDFCYWLQGFFEITGKTELTQEQIEMIKKHLQYVFTQGDLSSPPNYSITSGTIVKDSESILSEYLKKPTKIDATYC